MSRHARPHLEVHNRGQGHSAVAGVAYRLGLRLYDRRAGVWHDYRKRAIGEEIVRALTIAPEGAPAWATDPDELWNRAELAEKRKDAQVARDYRIPVPLGLTDDQAGDLGEEMARFICQELHTPVSMGLHRDADVDALGQVKPAEKVGFHAHLYFPTRKLEEIEGGGEGEGGEWTLGAKLVLLSNKTTGSGFIERLNQKWAELSNTYTAAQGLTADYDHRSYKRMDLDITPQPTLGAAVVAMERRGFFTRRGDALRGDIMVPSKVYEGAHVDELAAQHAQALVDVRNEPTPSHTLSEPNFVWMPDTLYPLNGLAARFQAASPAPSTPEEATLFHQVLRLVQTIERVLGTLARWAEQFAQLGEDLARRTTARLHTQSELDECRRYRTAAERKIKAWEEAHPWRMKVTRALGGESVPKELVEVADEVTRYDTHVQALKKAMTGHQQHLDDLANDEFQLKAQHVQQTQRLERAVKELAEMNTDHVARLLDVSNEQERAMLKPVAPVFAAKVEETARDEAMDPMEQQLKKMALELRPSAPKP